MQDSILVAGYPLGGDSLSITKGIVSRVISSACSTLVQQKRSLQRRMNAHSLCNANDAQSHTEFVFSYQDKACLLRQATKKADPLVTHSVAAGCDDTLCSCIQ